MNEIEEAVRKLILDTFSNLDELEERYRQALEREESELGREAFKILLENLEIARRRRIPVCQDTGVAVIYLRLGQEVELYGGSLYEAVNRGVARAYREAYLRKSLVSDPLFERRNTGDNTPAMIHLELVPGSGVELGFMPKGAGAENMSRIEMLKPAEGIEGVKRLVLETVSRAGANACPPLVIGVGIGGTLDMVGWLAKKALFRSWGERNPDPRYARLEEELLEEVNRLGIGPQGFGGRITALDVRIEHLPCHMASLPVAVNLNCHIHRVGWARL